METTNAVRTECLVSKTKIIKIQKWVRGGMSRLKRLPLIMYIIQKYLKSKAFQFSKQKKMVE